MADITSTLVVVSTSHTPGKEQDVRGWYINTHVPDVMNTGLFVRASYWASRGDDGQQPTFVAVYESDAEDPSRIMPTILEKVPEWHAAGHANPEFKAIHSGVYERVKVWER